MSLTYLDLFSGAGGWACGLEMAGLKHAGSYDINESACRTAGANLGKAVFCVDLRKFINTLDGKYPQPDLIVGSPPCQGFSNEGYKRKEDPRNSLVWTYLDIVEKLAPKVWIFENVPGFQRLYNGSYYEEFTQRLNSMSYYWHTFLLDASQYGVPQKRIRFFAIAAKDFQPEKPEPTHSINREIYGTAEAISLWEAIADLPKVGIGEKVGIFDYDKLPECGYQSWVREGSHRLENHTTQKHSQRVLEKISAVPIGGGMESLVGKYQENKVAYCGGYRRALKEQPSYTAYWTRGMTSIHPEENRFLSPRECARIQSFPDRFIFHGTTIENYTQICNAVPPLVARAYGRYLLKVLLGQEIPAIPWDCSHKTSNQLVALSKKEQNPIQLRLPI